MTDTETLTPLNGEYLDRMFHERTHGNTPAACPRCGKPYAHAIHGCDCVIRKEEQTSHVCEYCGKPHMPIPTLELRGRYCSCVSYTTPTEPPPLGWRCPGCGRVFAPDVKECGYCNG